MNPIATTLILATLFWSLHLTVRRGLGATFAYALLPVVLLAFTVQPIELQGIPNVYMVTGVSYGALLGLVLTGFRVPIRFGLIDACVALLILIRIVSGFHNGNLWTGVSTIGSTVLNVGVPYLIVRGAFVDRFWRLRAAQVIAGIAVTLTPILLVEARLIPLFYARHIMDPLGLTSVNWTLVQGRFGFFRAQGPFCHPIDLGNGAALMVALMLAFGLSSGARLRDKWLLTGLMCGIVMSLTSMSFTSFIALGAIIGLFVMLRFSRQAAWLLVPVGLAGGAFYTYLTNDFVSREPERVVWNYDETEDSHSGSLFIRHLIVYNTHQGEFGVPRAGWLGFGEDRYDPPRNYQLSSIDNSYIVFILINGWAYLYAFLLMAFVLATRATFAMLRIRDGESRGALAAGAAGIIGTMLGMYTVFFGFVYATLFWMVVGAVASMIREVDERSGRVKPVQIAAGRRGDAAGHDARGAFS